MSPDHHFYTAQRGTMQLVQSLVQSAGDTTGVLLVSNQQYHYPLFVNSAQDDSSLNIIHPLPCLRPLSKPSVTGPQSYKASTSRQSGNMHMSLFLHNKPKTRQRLYVTR